MPFYDHATPITRGSIVSCRFPLAETPDAPGPSARPALVVRVFRDTDHIWKAIVAYGTSRDTRSNAGHEIRVQGAERLAACGLHRPTRFTLSRMRVLPINPDFFAYAQTGSPILGSLDAQGLNALTTICDRLAAFAPELRMLTGGASVTVRSDMSAADAGEIAPTFDASRADRFLQKTCTGREHLNGLTPRPTSSNHVVEVRKTRRPRHLGLRHG